MEHAPAGICRLSREGEFLAVNSAFAAMLGYASRTEALEMARIGGLFADEDERQRVLRMVAPGAATDVEHVRLRGPGGRVTTLHMRARIAYIACAQDYIVIVDPAGG